MRIPRSVGLLSALRFLCSESSVLRTDSPIIVSGTSSPWHGSIGVGKCDYFLSTVRRNSWQSMLKILLFGSTAISFGLSGHAVLAKDASASESDQGDDYVIGLQRIEDSSVISNSHTIKWRIFTNNGRDLFQKGKLDEAEKFFLSALQEAKEGFGPRDAHVGSSCSNLAAIYTSRKDFDRAEPLYLEAISILEESFGIHDIRVGATLHNLGHFYLLQRKVEQAQKYYERALKIKGRVLGYGHPDYSSTMHHLSLVLYLQGKEKDSEELLRESIRILEENGLGETITCMKRMRSLVQMLLKSKRLSEAENLQRKILHIYEISKGWSLLETIIAAEDLAKTLHFLERLEESQELLERCLNARKKILPCDDVQPATRSLLLSFADVKEEYISCLNHLMNIVLGDAKNSSQKSSKASEELIEHAQQIKDDLSSAL